MGLTSVADPGCLFQFQDMDFSIPVPDLDFSNLIPDPEQNTELTKNLSIFSQKIVNKSKNMIRDVCPGSRIQIFSIPDPDPGVKKHWIPGPDL